jgi:hypothetical protein
MQMIGKKSKNWKYFRGRINNLSERYILSSRFIKYLPSEKCCREFHEQLTLA